MNQHQLPVYRHKREILSVLSNHQVLIVESPTGSGKTTQIPAILHEAGYCNQGIIAVTQPRRIATLSISSFISKQLGQNVAYKMRFGDTTTSQTKIKILTDGILLQEIRHDPLLSTYSIIMVDEAHERTLNIDFLLGLLKQVLARRPDLKVIISSATINTQTFIRYFYNAPVVSIDAPAYPVTVMYDPPTESGEEQLLMKIVSIVERIVLQEQRHGDILIFLSGERQIKQCLRLLSESRRLAKKLWILPLYGMLTQEEQEKVFQKAPWDKVKVVASTNIAETSLTIDGVTTVIDSGLCKENVYNPHTYISTLSETTISRASANQRKGRAGRTRAGFCYRLYSKEDFQQRASFSLEEIYRTDLSEVVLRMAALDIHDFTGFDFISRPSRSGIQGAVATLKLLDALDKDNCLTEIGAMMTEFPLLPRHGRILVESIKNYPTALRKCCIITAFLSTNSPFVLTDGKEDLSRQAHHSFAGQHGDFANYIQFFDAYANTQKKENFCKQFHLDKQTMDEIINIERQLESIAQRYAGGISDQGPMRDVLICCGRGLAQFLCMRTGRCTYRGLTAERIFIHPGSVVWDKEPHFIMAGEILKTSRMYARSIAPLDSSLLREINPRVYAQFMSDAKQENTQREKRSKNYKRKKEKDSRKSRKDKYIDI